MTLLTPLALTLALALSAANPEETPDPRAGAAAILSTVLAEAERAESAEERLARLLDSGGDAAERLGERRTARLVREALDEARTLATTDREAAVERLEARLKWIASDLTFEPEMEAPLPVDFPEPTPVGELELKRYPAYRVATAPMKGRASGAFWTLFGHIKKHDIPMTAPVESTYGEDEVSAVRMGFLYQSPEVGDAGIDGAVEVIDVPARHVVSLGLRGYATDQRVRDARRELLEWIEAREDLAVDGALRTMGFNSPMVQGTRRYFEVQLPVRVVESGASSRKVTL